jgi:hypothetical protein
LTTNAMGFRAGGHPCAPLYPCTPSAILSSSPSLCLDKKEKRGEKGESEKEKGSRKKYRGLVGTALPSSMSHGGPGLDFFHYYAEPSAKTLEAWVYVSGGARGLSGAGGPYIPRACGIMSGDSACLRISSSACSCGIMTSSFIT